MLTRILFLLALAFPAFATITAVTSQECTNTTTTGSAVTCTMPGNMTTGNAVALWIGYTGTGRTISSVTGTGCTANVMAGPGSGSRLSWLYVLTGCTSTVITVTLSGSVAVRLNVAGKEFTSSNGSFAGNPNDVGSCTTLSDCTNNATSTTASTAVFTPTASLGEVVFSVCSNGNNSSGTSSGWTDITVANASMAAAWQIVASTSGTLSRSWTISASNTWDTTIGGFKEPAGAASPVRHRVISGALMLPDANLFPVFPVFAGE